MCNETCPYCNAPVEINHDDGYGMGEDERHEDDCGKCGKTFVYETTISVDHVTYKAPCKNGDPHNLVDIRRIPSEFGVGWKACTYCGEEFLVDAVASKEAIDSYYALLFSKEGMKP
jgi:hypothetical protein